MASTCSGDFAEGGASFGGVLERFGREGPVLDVEAVEFGRAICWVRR